MRAMMKSAVALSVSLAALSGMAGCNQPEVTCTVARGTFVAQYRRVSVLPSPSGDTSCGDLVGEDLMLNAFNQPSDQADKNPDPSKVRLAIQPMGISELVWNASGLPEPVSPPEGDVPYGLGDFDSLHPKDDWCNVPTVTRAHVALPAIPEMMSMPDECTLNTYPASEAVDVAYEWTNIRVYVTPAATGTQFTARLKYTKDGCVAEYDVTALYPSISCVNYRSSGENPATDPDAGDSGLYQDAGLGGMDANVPVPDEAGIEEDATAEEDAGEEDAGPEIDCGMPEEEEDPGTPFADDSVCGQSPNINPDFMVKCDPDLLRCVLNAPPPALK